jgi:hypothetical protein
MSDPTPEDVRDWLQAGLIRFAGRTRLGFVVYELTWAGRVLMGEKK